MPARYELPPLDVFQEVPLADTPGVTEFPLTLAGPIYPTVATEIGGFGTTPYRLLEPFVTAGTIDNMFNKAGTSYPYKNGLGMESWSEWARENKTAIYAGVATVAILAYMKGR